MQPALRMNTTIQPSYRLELRAPERPETAKVRVIVVLPQRFNALAPKKAARWQFLQGAALPGLYILSVCAVFATLCGSVRAEEPIRITVHSERVRQVFEGLGAGAIFYEGHITSLAARNKNEL